MNHQFKDLVDIHLLQELTDELYAATGIPSAVVTMDGEILTGSGWQRICTQFHRMHPEIEKECIASDTHINNALENGEPFVMYRCPRGLVDASSPVIIEGEHVANVFAGQLFTNQPDEALETEFRQQARKFGLDEEEYIKAFREVPVIPEAKFRKALSFLAKFAQFVAQVGLARIREIDAHSSVLNAKKRYDDIINRIPVGVYTYHFQPDGKGQFDYFSAQAGKILGVDPTEALNNEDLVFSHAHPDDFDSLMRAIREARRTLISFRWEGRAIRDGSIRWIRIESESTPLPNGESSWDGVISDITDWKQAHEEVQESHDLISNLARLVPGVIYQYRLYPDGRSAFPYASPGMNMIYEVTPEEVQEDATPVFSRLHPDDADRVAELIFSSARTLETFYCEFRVVLPRQGLRWRWSQAHPERTPDGGTLWHGIISDITERKQVEEDLRRSEAKFRDLFHKHSAVKLLIDPDSGQIVDANETAEKFYGWNADMLRGMKIQQINILTPDQVETEMVKAKNSSRVYFEFRHRLADGSIRDVAVYTSLVDFGGKRLLHSIVHDITTQRTLEEQLMQAQKMESIGRLAGGVAHDFNNILTSILGNAEMVLQDLTPEDPNYWCLKEIQQSAQRSADITRQLLGFARKQTIVPKMVDLNKLLVDSQKMLRRLIGESINLQFVPGESLWSVSMDPAQFDQIVMNLCVNARDAIDSHGEITLKTSNQTLDNALDEIEGKPIVGDYVLLQIADNGKGMDEEVLLHAFEPFFTTKPIGQGTGLGLSTVFGIVKQNGGYMKVESIPGSGTTFSIYLPRLENVAIIDEKSLGISTIPRGGETILVVEDEPVLLNLAKALLIGLGYKVLPAPEPAVAIELFRDHRDEISMVLTDIVMPGMNGTSLYKFLRTEKPSLKVLFMSGYSEEIPGLTEAIEAGAVFLQKPFNRKSLAEAIRRGFDQKSDS